MIKLTQREVDAMLQLRYNGHNIAPADIAQAMLGVTVTFGQIDYITQVETAAAYKAMNLLKCTTANVILVGTVNAYTSVYANRVKKTAKQYVNDPAAVAAFTPQKNWFIHKDPLCLVEHEKFPDKFYLYVIYNGASSVYTNNGRICSKDFVKGCLTPSAARAMDAGPAVENKTYGVVHSVQVRTIALSNIVALRVRKGLLIR